MEEKEEGEISLEDVSSSEDLNVNTHRKRKSRSHKNKFKAKMNDKRVEVDIRCQDAAYGKENRKCSNGFIGLEHKTLMKKEESKDGLTPISSEEEIEYVRVPGNSTPVLIKTGLKKKRKKKKKKKTGTRMLTIDDLESDRDFNSSQPINYTAAPVIYNDMMRETITITTTNHQTRAQQSTRQHYRSPVRSSFRSSSDHPRSPPPSSSSRRRSPTRKFSPVRPSTSSSSSSCSPLVSNKHCLHKTNYQNKRNDDNHNEAYTSELLKKVKAYDTFAITPARQNRYKESSLKDKLNNMNKLNTDCKDTDDSSSNIINQDISNESIKKEDIDEEDIDFLRRLALDTQQQSKHDDNNDDEHQQQQQQEIMNDNSQTISFNSNDHNVEELQLRADALKTAVMNKCKNKGLFIKKRDKTIIKDKATYNDSLLNDVIDNIEENSEYSPSNNSIHYNRECDDMELDSDVEREKITSSQALSPYSPTDEVEDTFADSYLVSDSFDKNKNEIIDPEAPYSPSDIPANNELLSTSLSNTTVEFSDNLINNISAFSTNKQGTVNSNSIKNQLYDEVIRDLEKDYGPIYRDNETNNKITINSKLVPASILRVNKHLQQSLPLKKIDNNNTVKVFKSAEMQPVDIVDNKFVKTNTTFKPIKIPQPVKKSLASSSAQAFDNCINDESIIPDDSLLTTDTTESDNNFKRKSERPKTPAKKIIIPTTVVTTTFKNIDDKKAQINKDTKKSSDNSTSDQVLKKKNDNLLIKVPKVKNLKKSESESSENEKKRRSSFEEEELRALALASLSKRAKQPPSGQQSDSLIKESSDTTTTKELKKNNNVLLEKQSSDITTEPIPINNNLQSDNSSSPSTVISNTTINKKKRPIITDSQGPPKKIIKKTVKANESTLLTTVNPVIQKKLIQNQKKIPPLLQTSSINKNNNNNVKITADSVESLTSKITSTKKIQRMVINLGEDSDTDSDSGKTVLISKPTILKTPLSKFNNKSLAVPDVDFEKKIEDFLRSQREKTESTVSKSSNSDKTPQAMRHLPPDMLEEYRRLKQRAAELEKNKTNDKRTQNSDKPNSVKSTKLITTSKNLTKKIIKPGINVTNNIISTSDNTLLTTKSINVSESTSSSSLSSKKEENRLKVIANCSQEILKGIPRTNKKIYSLPKATDNVSYTTNETIAQNIDIKPSESTDNITETVIRTAISNDNHSLDNINLLNDPTDDLLTFEEQKVDPNIIESISNSPGVVKSSSNVINWQTVSTEDLSVNNNYDKLVIQISNTRDIDVSSRRQVNVIKTNNDKKLESDNSQHKVSSPFLKILTADQLNMRANQSSLPIMVTTTTEEITTTSNNQQQFDSTEEITIEESKVDIIHDDELIPENLVSTNRINIINSELLVNNDSSSLSESTIATELNTAQAFEINKTQDRELLSEKNPTEKMNAEIESAINQYKLLSFDEQQIKLAAMESEFTEKKQMKLNAYNLLTENLQELEIERQVQSDLSSQVKKLRAELKLAEERLKVQQEKLSGIKNKIITNKSTVYDRRIECNNHERICIEMGLIVVGKEYKIPTIRDQSSRDAMKQVASRIKRLKKKKTGSEQQLLNDDTSSVSSKDTTNNDDQSVSIKIEENSIESLNSASVDDTTPVIKTKRSEINVNTEEEIPIRVSVKEEIIDIELDALPVDSEFTISYPNLENELSQMEMNFIAKNEQDKETDELNELESRLTPIDLSLPESIQKNNINADSIEPKTENDSNLLLPVFSGTPSGDTSSLIRPIVKIPKQNSSSDDNNLNNKFQNVKRLVKAGSLANKSDNCLPKIHKGCEKINKSSQSVQSYESILPVFNSARSLDPNGVLCPYDLNGKCKDDACKYSHLNRRSTS